MAVSELRKREVPEERSSRKDPAKKCCVDRFALPPAPLVNDVIRPSAGVRRTVTPFKMEADFSSATAGCECKCCEYKQSVRGYFMYDGQPLKHMLPSGEMSETEFKEDGITNPPPGPHFGHRDEIGAADDRYLPARADGCEYRGTDNPGIRGAPGVRFEVNLEFKGEIIDVCNNRAVLREATWTVKFSGRLSTRSKYWD
ncbi:MAG: hypothetical protein IH602_24120 [Bryobacteraceae bacterium]|nr:hypothetical protein [Bryobacteraceae bacterium]